MELIDVYDSSRNRTGRVVDRHLIWKGAYRLIAHACVFDDSGRMLVQRRSSKKRSLPGYWDVSAGGQVGAGEDSEEGASRELFEELGLRRRFSEEDRVCTVRFDHGFDDYYITGSRRDDSLLLQGDEVSEVSWCTCGEIERMIDDRVFIQYRPEFIRGLFDCFYRCGRIADTDDDGAFMSFDRYAER